MEFLFLYLADLVENVSVIAIPIVIIEIALVITICLYAWEERCMFTDSKGYKEELIIFKKLKKIFLVNSLIILSLCLIPSRATLLMVGGKYYLKKGSVNNEKLIKINKLIDLELDKRIKELENK